MNTDNEIADAYFAYDSLTAKLLEKFPPEAIAGVMAVQALTLYKTILTADDYESMINTLYESRNQVTPIAKHTLQ